MSSKWGYCNLCPLNIHGSPTPEKDRKRYMRVIAYIHIHTRVHIYANRHCIPINKFILSEHLIWFISYTWAHAHKGGSLKSQYTLGTFIIMSYLNRLMHIREKHAFMTLIGILCFKHWTLEFLILLFPKVKK